MTAIITVSQSLHSLPAHPTLPTPHTRLLPRTALCTSADLGQGCLLLSAWSLALIQWNQIYALISITSIMYYLPWDCDLCLCVTVRHFKLPQVVSLAACIIQFYRFYTVAYNIKMASHPELLRHTDCANPHTGENYFVSWHILNMDYKLHSGLL